LLSDRERNRLGWMGKHSRLVRAVGSFVLILNNADFLWVTATAKAVSVSVYIECMSQCVCVRVFVVCPLVKSSQVGICCIVYGTSVRLHECGE